jgi:hypothetical protein
MTAKQQPRVEIRPGTPRDLCFIAANLRQWDRRELSASALLSSMTEAAMLSWYMSGPQWCWTAWLGDQPQAAFGVSTMGPMQPHLRSAWCWGTDRLRRCAPAITRFCVKEWPSRLIGEGVTRVEIRSLEGHDLAHRWLAGLKAHHEGAMKGYGTNGETFELWAWLKEDWQ